MDSSEALQPPTPAIPADSVPMKAHGAGKEESQPKFLPMVRRGLGTEGPKIQLLSNHFRVGVGIKDGFFYHYSVAMSYEDGNPVEAKGIGRKVIDKVSETYDELKSMNFAYDGEKNLFTLGSLKDNNMEFIVVLEDLTSRRAGRSDAGLDSPTDGDKKRMRRQSQFKTIKVVISYAAQIPIQAIADALRGQDSEHSQEALRVLDIILRQHAAKQGCVLVRQSFFHDNPRNYTDIGGGVLGCRGFHSSFRPTQGGLSLNIDASTTMVVKPGPVLDFLCDNQNVMNSDYGRIDWTKAKRVLKSLRIRVNNMEYKITGLSENPCSSQFFSLKDGKDENGEPRTIEITVYDYFKRHKNIELRYADFPCINVGKPRRPTYFPVELCSLIPLQRYTKALTYLQRTQLVQQSRQTPNEKKDALATSLRNSRYGNQPMLRSARITINSDFTRVEGRILPPPKLVFGNWKDFTPKGGRWNFNDKELVKPVEIQHWAVVNFSADCNLGLLRKTIIKCAEMKGIKLSLPWGDQVFHEDDRSKHDPAPVRVKKMYDLLMSKISSPPELLLCILPERKNSEIYGPWKRRSLVDVGVPTQCIAPTRINDQYITNVLLKINAKLRGMNSSLSMELYRSMPLIHNEATLILGMDVSHGAPGRSDAPSIAAVVSSRAWPSISCYRAAVRTQSPRVEMIQSLFKPVPSDTGNKDEGIIRELVMDFYKSSGNRKPQQIIIFRDGVSESQFIKVLNEELVSIIEACKYLDENWRPKFTFIVAQKNHHTRFFKDNAPDNVPPGTVVDTQICHPKNNDFYMCAHAGMIGTTRPTHYQVLHDEIGFSADDLQEFVHSLSYVYQRSTTAISIVAPICYAHLAAAQMGQFIKNDELPETSSSHGGATSSGAVQVPELPLLHEAVANSMFFC